VSHVLDVELAVTHATVVTAGPAGVVDDGVVLVRDGVIGYVGAAATAPAYRAAETIAARGRYVFPGLINTHNHLYQSLLRALPAPRQLGPWLEAIILPALSRLRPEVYEVAAALACAEALHSGVTTVIDYTVDHDGMGMYKAAMAGAERVGARLRLARGLSGRGRPDVTPQPLSSKLDEVRILSGMSAEPVGLGMPPIASMTDEALSLVAEFAAVEGVPVTAHIAEDPAEDAASRQRHGASTLRRLAGCGLLGPAFLAVHCVHIDDDDIAILAQTGTSVSYNPVSNHFLSTGQAPVRRLLDHGVTVALGTDGAASNGKQDMIEVMKFAALAPDAPAQTATAAHLALTMATRDAARAVGATDRGTIAPGQRADFFIFDPARSLSTVPATEPESTLVYSGSPAGVADVVVGGEVVLRDGIATQIDEAELKANAISLARALAAAS
jgi:5-methylthioadenosine/S-adenosylhomocysteine deaminase